MQRPQTSLSRVFQSIRNQKTVFQVSFSLWDRGLMDILFECPTLQEAESIYHLKKLHPREEWRINLETIYQYILQEEAIDWMLTKAPAGILPSTCIAIDLIGRVHDSPSFNASLDVCRTQKSLIGSLESVLYGDMKISPDAVKKMTKHEFASLVAASEEWLRRNEMIEGSLDTRGPTRPFEDIWRPKGITGGLVLQKGFYEAPKPPLVVSQVKTRPVIDFEKENQALASMGLEDVELDPMYAIFESQVPRRGR